MDSVLLSAALAYMDVGVSREQDAVATAYMDVGVSREQDAVATASRADFCSRQNRHFRHP